MIGMENMDYAASLLGGQSSAMETPRARAIKLMTRDDVLIPATTWETVGLETCRRLATNAWVRPA